VALQFLGVYGTNEVESNVFGVHVEVVDIT
jgi:hypothetical protein